MLNLLAFHISDFILRLGFPYLNVMTIEKLEGLVRGHVKCHVDLICLYKQLGTSERMPSFTSLAPHTNTPRAVYGTHISKPPRRPHHAQG